MDDQKRVTKYYNRFSKVYNLISSKIYYHIPRDYSVRQLRLSKDDIVLNVPCGTGVNFDYFESYLKGSGRIFAVDLSEGMLAKAEKMVLKKGYTNIEVIKENVLSLNCDWMNSLLNDSKFDAILCDLGLSGFPNWKAVIQNFYSMLKVGGRLVIMDFYIEKNTFRSKYLRFFGKGKTNRKISKFVSDNFVNVSTNHSFKNGDMFVTTIIRD